MAAARRYRLDERYSAAQTELLRTNLAAAGWTPTTGDDWQLDWCFGVQPAEVFAGLVDGQRVNHYPGVGTIHYKDELHHFLARARDRLAARGGVGWYDFFPRSFSMPDEYPELQRAAAGSPEAVWIQKPKRGATGMQNRLLADASAAARDDDQLVQEYVADPLLFADHPHKHVLRIWVAITSLDPLVAYLHTNAVVKFTSRPYTLAPESRDDLLVHMTNPEVQVRGDVPALVLDMDAYRRRLAAAGVDDTAVWDGIRHMMTQAVIAHRGPLLELSRNWCDRVDLCFEVLGYDILLDTGLKPWLIEANISPSMLVEAPPGTAAAHAHQRAKDAMVADLLGLIGAGRDAFDDTADPSRLAGEERRGGGFERIVPATDVARYLPCYEEVTPSDRALMRLS